MYNSSGPVAEEVDLQTVADEEKPPRYQSRGRIEGERIIIVIEVPAWAEYYAWPTWIQRVRANELNEATKPAPCRPAPTPRRMTAGSARIRRARPSRTRRDAAHPCAGAATAQRAAASCRRARPWYAGDRPFGQHFRSNGTMPVLAFFRPNVTLVLARVKPTYSIRSPSCMPSSPPATRAIAIRNLNQ